jgi:ribosomal protein S18 acetylase RimI-like enzyme
MTPRPALPGDALALYEGWERLADDGQRADPAFQRSEGARQLMLPRIRDLWMRTSPFPHCLVVDGAEGIGGYIAGMVIIPLGIIDQPPTARITDLWVRPERRRAGVGRSLVAEFVRAAVLAGYPLVEVGTLTRDERAVAFWRAMGFGDWQVTLRRYGSCSLG